MKLTIRLSHTIAALFIGATLVTRLPAAPLDLLITDVRAIIGDGTVLESTSIGISGEEIVWVGPTNEAPEAALLINGNGHTAMPGLMDAHVHMIEEVISRDPESLASYMDATLPHWLNGMLIHGVTTIRALGDPIEESLLIQEQVEVGQIVGPRIVASGPGLTHPRGHPFATMYTHYPDMHERFVSTSNDVDEARAIIRSYIEAGLDSPLKLVFHGGESEAEHYEYMGTEIVRTDPDVLAAAIDEAHLHGYRTTVHTFDYDEALLAALSDVDGIEHGVVTEPMPDNRLIEAMLERDIAVVSTIRLHAKFKSPNTAISSANLKRMYDAGITIVAGSDTPVGWTYPGLDTIFELEALVAAGIPEQAAIEAATANAAHYLEIDDKVGYLRPGLLADILLVRGNPLEDIIRMRATAYVIKEGTVVRGL